MSIIIADMDPQRVKHPTNLFKSVPVESLNTPTAFVSIEALKSSHWLLAFVGAAAITSEACKLEALSHEMLIS
jgi:hypothetical protein